MLIAILLTLTAEHDAVLPAHLGRANYAETLKRISQPTGNCTNSSLR